MTKFKIKLIFDNYSNLNLTNLQLQYFFKLANLKYFRF